MAVLSIKENVFSVGAEHWDRKLFDEIIPLPDGTSYNSFLIKGKSKTVLIDTVDPSCQHILIENLKKLKIKNIDYIISNHAEQDHSGAIPEILKIYPNSKVVTNSKCKEFLKDLLLIPEEKFLTINENDTLSLGDKNLKFIFTPWVHWPETMVTYLVEDKILFTCDFFGSHIAKSELWANDEKIAYEAAKRYYAEIMMPFRNNIKNNIEKILKLDIEIIAPSHGFIYKNPDFIINAYKEWISDNVSNNVVILYVSMHGSVKRIVEYLTDFLIEKGINVLPFNLTVADIGEIAISLVDSATVVIVSPTFLTGAHPLVYFAVNLFNALRPKTKFISIISSYSWGSNIINSISEIVKNLKAEIIDTILIKGYPKESDIQLLKNLAEKIFQKHNALNLF
jgi:flavorubredoxin